VRPRKTESYRLSAYPRELFVSRPSISPIARLPLWFFKTSRPIDQRRLGTRVAKRQRRERCSHSATSSVAYLLSLASSMSFVQRLPSAPPCAAPRARIRHNPLKLLSIQRRCCALPRTSPNTITAYSSHGRRNRRRRRKFSVAGRALTQFETRSFGSCAAEGRAHCAPRSCPAPSAFSRWRASSYRPRVFHRRAICCAAAKRRALMIFGDVRDGRHFQIQHAPTRYLHDQRHWPARKNVFVRRISAVCLPSFLRTRTGFPAIRRGSRTPLPQRNIVEIQPLS